MVTVNELDYLFLSTYMLEDTQVIFSRLLIQEVHVPVHCNAIGATIQS